MCVAQSALARTGSRCRECTATDRSSLHVGSVFKHTPAELNLWVSQRKAGSRKRAISSSTLVTPSRLPSMKKGELLTSLRAANASAGFQARIGNSLCHKLAQTVRLFWLAHLTAKASSSVSSVLGPQGLVTIQDSELVGKLQVAWRTELTCAAWCTSHPRRLTCA